MPRLWATTGDAAARLDDVGDGRRVTLFLHGSKAQCLAADPADPAQDHTPDQPDWHILMAQGAVLDQLERGEEARKYYETALKIVPNEPSILSNYGLSYALSGDLTNAETVLRRAYASPRADMRVRQNLSLVLALAGKLDEAQRVASQDLSPPEAAQNIAYLRSMVGQNNNWKKLKQLERRRRQDRA